MPESREGRVSQVERDVFREIFLEKVTFFLRPEQE